MSQVTTLPAVQPTRRRRWRLIAGLLLVVIAVPAAAWWYLSWAEQRDFAAALAETEALDPGWRLDDIEAARAVLHDGQNSALVVIRLRKLLGGTVWLGQRIEEEMGALPLNVRFNAEHAGALNALLAKHAKARVEAERLKELSNGRYPRLFDPQNLRVNYDPLQWMREAQHFIHLDAFLSADNDDSERAMALCRAALNNARSVGDEPSVIAHLVRVACLEISVGTLERVLAQTTAAPGDLRHLQELLQREVDEPRLWQAMRGERALGMKFLAGIEDGRVPRSVMGTTKSGWRRWVADWLPASVAVNRADYLRATNALVEASKLPVEKQLDAVEQVIDQWGQPGTRLESLLPIYNKLTAAHLRNQARLRCALVAVAVERYRHEHERWPESLEALLRDGPLKGVPLDPYDGRPLRYRRLGDGILVYSVNVDRTDDGGILDRTNPMTRGTDLGFRLWDPEARRQ